MLPSRDLKSPGTRGSLASSTTKPYLKRSLLNQDVSASMISSASAIEREVNHITNLIHQSAKEEAEEEKQIKANNLFKEAKKTNMSFERYIR
jgi:hypothetical protein